LSKRKWADLPADVKQVTQRQEVINVAEMPQTQQIQQQVAETAGAVKVAKGSEKQQVEGGENQEAQQVQLDHVTVELRLITQVPQAEEQARRKLSIPRKSQSDDHEGPGNRSAAAGTANTKGLPSYDKENLPMPVNRTSTAHATPLVLSAASSFRRRNAFSPKSGWKSPGVLSSSSPAAGTAIVPAQPAVGGVGGSNSSGGRSEGTDPMKADVQHTAKHYAGPGHPSTPILVSLVYWANLVALVIILFVLCVSLQKDWRKVDLETVVTDTSLSPQHPPTVSNTKVHSN
jgi:hypothetical protein